MRSSIYSGFRRRRIAKKKKFEGRHHSPGRRSIMGSRHRERACQHGTHLTGVCSAPAAQFPRRPTDDHGSTECLQTGKGKGQVGRVRQGPARRGIVLRVWSLIRLRMLYAKRIIAGHSTAACYTTLEIDPGRSQASLRSGGNDFTRCTLRLWSGGSQTWMHRRNH